MFANRVLSHVFEYTFVAQIIQFQTGKSEHIGNKLFRCFTTQVIKICKIKYS